MGSDLARISFDPKRHYRSVVAQQGRVTLEADVNEASRIAAEALRLETIDLVGPAATPDDGYKVGLDANGQVSVGPGTLYLGGWRLRLDAAVPLDAQTDWLDMPAVQAGSALSLVALLASEQSVCAVEDTVLREVALGGPDTAARTRLMQHFLRLPARGQTCEDAAGGLAALLQQDGITIDPATDRLLSSARLQVGFTPPAAPPDPCEPAAQGGYLGADNQMMRVTVTAFDPQKRAGTLAWGWNNASFLYRATVASPTTLSLSPVPLDTEHAPQQGQAVEILLTQADLGNGDLIASAAGSFAVLTQAYDPDTNLLTLPTGFTLPDTKYPLFVRLWQAVVPFVAGTPVALDSVSGLTVTIDMAALPKIAGRPFWHFAVRPDTPVMVYPRRYLDAPQPPAGPRQWLCDLAVVRGTLKDFQVLDDCRVSFPRGGDCCCATVLGPQDLADKGGLQAALDSLAASGQPATLSLRPGIYTLSAPVTLTAKHERITIEGCADGVVLQADATALAGFANGMLVLQQATGITLRRLVLELPAAPSPFGDQIVQMLAVWATDCTDLTIEACQFVFAPSPKTSPIGAGVFAQGNCQGAAMRRNSFVCTTVAGTQARDLFGVYLVAGTEGGQLDDVEISFNLFAGLGFAVGANAATALGLMQISNNKIRQCACGIILASAGVNLSQAASDKPPAPATGLPDLRPETLLALSSQLQRAISAAGAKLSGAPGATDKPSATTKKAAVAAAGLNALLDALEQDMAAAELAGQAPVPVLHIRDNDMTLSASSTFSGLSITLTGNQTAQALISGNRIATPGIGVAAATVTMYPGQMVVTGNLFTQGSVKAPTTVPCLGVQNYAGGFEVMANVVQGQTSILPARPTPLPATTAWEFLNTVG